MKENLYGWSSMNSGKTSLMRLIVGIVFLSMTLAASSTVDVDYAPMPESFRKLPCDHPEPCPWETWTNDKIDDGAEILRYTVSLANSKERWSRLMSWMELDAVHFKKIRTRTGIAGFGGVLENYTVGYSEDPKGPKESLAIWRATKGGHQRVIVTQYPISQTKQIAQVMTDQIAAESRRFLRSR